MLSQEDFWPALKRFSGNTYGPLRAIHYLTNQRRREVHDVIDSFENSDEFYDAIGKEIFFLKTLSYHQGP